VTLLLIVNPNSSVAVTDAIASVAASLLAAGTYAVEQIDEGPTVIEDETAARQAAALVCERLWDRYESFHDCIVACHGDPGVDEAARMTGKPVRGIGGASLRAAAARGARFGVITLGGQLVESKWRQLVRWGLADRCAAVEPTNTGVLHALSDGAPDLAPYLAAGRRAIERGASSLVLGCAGMTPTAQALERELGVPVIEPVEAAIREALDGAPSGARTV
jgi:allantoin racemase